MELHSKTIQEYEKNIYDLNQLLQVSRALTSSLDYEYILDIILDTTLTQAYTQHTALLLAPNLESLDFHFYKNTRGFDFSDLKKFALKISSETIESLLQMKSSMTLQEFQEIVKPSEKSQFKFLKKINTQLLIPLAAKGRILGFVVLADKIDQKKYTEHEKKHLQDLMMLASISIENAHLFKQATTDFKTTLKNYAYWNYFSNVMYRKAAINKQQLNLMILDIDDFKNINDTYGHLFGDKILKFIATCCLQIVDQPNSLLVRYGGEEFCILVPDVSQNVAYKIAEKIRKKIFTKKIFFLKNKVKISVSIGVSSIIPDAESSLTIEHLFEEADQALYKAKKLGKNTTQIYEQK